MDERLDWGILGTGVIARTFARGVSHSKRSRLVAVGSRSEEGARSFGDAHPGIRTHGTYASLLADPGVRAVYIATPHPQHVEWVVKAAEAGKHILCEKPIGLNHAEAMVAFEAARAGGVLLMEAFMYRCAPVTAKLVELLRGRTCGEVKAIQATFSYRAGFDPDIRHFSNALGGGGILDVGCYPVSLARLVAGIADGQPFSDPVEVKGVADLNSVTGVDDVASAVLRFPSGIIAQVATGVGVNQDNSARIYCTEGWIHLPDFWIPAREGGAARIIVHPAGRQPREVIVETVEWLYGIEADAVAQALSAGALEVPAMTAADTLGNMAALDAWRRSAGLVYEAEKPEAVGRMNAVRPKATRALNPIPRAHVAGLKKPVSRLILGCDNPSWMPEAAALWDDWFDRGGNAFDTAYMYQAGLSEKLLGHWMASRGVRSEATVICKGAHTPFCTPDRVTSQLFESLERLQTDHADIYILHRDNTDVPVGEFVDVIDGHFRSGIIQVAGVSNWTLRRYEEANAYARREGRHGFALLNNQFSLARMVEPPWPGCISAGDPESRRWLQARQAPLFAWSSQARGFFTGRAGPEKRSDAELVRCWYADDNFERRARAVALAKELGVLPINVALAYVLCQPFPTWALVGPREISETVSTLGGANLKLTPKQLAWLNLEAGSMG
jgi:predicted dehydrogenase/aryl-alcohol dehydrogenase-like predicted oxidoreductase